MPHIRWAALCVLAVTQTAHAQGQAFDLEPGTKVLGAIQYKQLAILPLVKQVEPLVQQAQYLTLAEGLQKKLVTVTERKEGATVNRVQVANASERPLLLLGGEVILGGQQDRILGKDTIIPPHEQMLVEVFCVEHGRWTGGKAFTAAGGLAEGKMRVRAKYRSDQREVWAEVAEKTKTLRAESSTGTYRKIAAGPEGEKAIKPYRDYLAGKLPQKNMVGVIAAINGRVTSVDVFDNPQLFAAYRDKLLDSIYVTAADVRETPAAKAAPTAAQIKQFMQDADGAKGEALLENQEGRTIEKKGKTTVNSTLEDKKAGKPVYKSYQANE